jgi:glycolate oxidase
MTTNHVLGLELVAGEGETYHLGGPAPDAPGYDLTGVVVGSEGTLGVVTAAWVRLLPLPPTTVTFLALFGSLEAAGEAVSEIIARGIVPSALELIDGPTARALEEAFRAGYPANIEGVLLIDLDGRPEDVAEEAAVVEAVCREIGARGVRSAESAQEREALWAARKGGLAALARIAPNYYLHDMVVPRSRLAATLKRVLAIADEHGVFVSNVAHAGDGNLHPTILFDLRQPGILPKIIEAGEAILRVGVEAGGTISGEHGIGLEKQEYMAWIFGPDDLAVMRRVRDAFSPGELFNPGKLFPQGSPREARIKVWASAAVSSDTWI